MMTAADALDGPVLLVRTAPPLEPSPDGRAGGADMLPIANTARPRIGWPPRGSTRPPEPERPGLPPVGVPGAAPEVVPATMKPPAQRAATPRLAPRDEPARPRQARSRTALQRYVSMCVEVLNGFRPVIHLRPLTVPHRFADISDQLTRRTTRVRMSPGQAARDGRLVRVRRLLASEPVPGVAEGVVVLEQGETCWAMAVRMERTRTEVNGPPSGGGIGGWFCTVVQVI